MAASPDLHNLARATRYNVEAFGFVSQSLRHAAKLYGKDAAKGEQRHLSPEQLVEGALDLAVERYGLLADLVLRSWGLRTSEDLGAVTFTLIKHGVFTKQPTDRLEDFSTGPDFTEVVRERVCGRINTRRN
jgi:uncharacterized repeat protein (TIGR04138 family)